MAKSTNPATPTKAAEDKPHRRKAADSRLQASRAIVTMNNQLAARLGMDYPGGCRLMTEGLIYDAFLKYVVNGEKPPKALLESIQKVKGL